MQAQTISRKSKLHVLVISLLVSAGITAGIAATTLLDLSSGGASDAGQEAPLVFHRPADRPASGFDGGASSQAIPFHRPTDNRTGH